MKIAAYALMPLFLLVLLVSLACVFGYGLLLAAGDIVALDKLISKSTQFFLILCIFPLKKHLKFSWTDLGFAPVSIFFQQILQGFLLGLLTLMPVILTLYMLDVQIIDETKNWTIGKIAEKIGLGLLLSLLIGLFEEILFRGLLLTSLKQKISGLAAILVSSFYYAGLHFLKSKTSIPYQELSFSSGFKLMAEAFSNCFNPEIFGAFVSLLAVGIFLATLRSHIPQSLGLCIGCHCGWVWQIKTSKELFNVNPQSDYLYLVSNYDGVIGPLVSCWLGLAILAYYLFNRRSAAWQLKSL